MKVNDASVLEAFGYDQAREQGSDVTVSSIRPGPLSNFFVVYGLAFETISRSFGNTSARQESIAAAKALQTLVKPIYSGAALFSSSIFDELCTLCYRIAIGEGAALRTEMMQIMSGFAYSRGPSGDQDQIRRVVAVITYTLRVSIGTAEAQSNCRYASLVIRGTTAADGFQCGSIQTRSLALRHGSRQDPNALDRVPGLHFGYRCFGCRN
jgi:hypothetical protein